MEFFTTRGPVRGECGHKHRTEKAAEACLYRDARACARVGGYTDRAVVRSWGDGHDELLVDDGSVDFVDVDY